MPKLKEETQIARREQIATAAMACFARNGFANTSMADIIAEAGLSAGSIYSHFATKADLIRYSAAGLLEHRTQALRDEVEANGTVMNPAALADSLLTQIEADRSRTLLLLQVWAEIPRDSELGVVASENVGRLRSMIADSLEAWAAEQDGGDSPERAQAIALESADALVALLQGSVVRMAFDPQAQAKHLRAGLAHVLKS